MVRETMLEQELMHLERQGQRLPLGPELLQEATLVAGAGGLHPPADLPQALSRSQIRVV